MSEQVERIDAGLEHCKHCGDQITMQGGFMTVGPEYFCFKEACFREALRESRCLIEGALDAAFWDLKQEQDQ